MKAPTGIARRALFQAAAAGAVALRSEAQTPNFVLKQMTCLLTLLWQTDARAKEIGRAHV